MNKNKVVITIEAEEEMESPERAERNASPGYAEAVREIKKTADGRWGWCSVKVEAKIGEKVGTTYLGNCSYYSAQDFIDSGYFEGMVKDAIADALNRDLKSTIKEIKRLWDERFPGIGVVIGYGIEGFDIKSDADWEEARSFCEKLKNEGMSTRWVGAVSYGPKEAVKP